MQESSISLHDLVPGANARIAVLNQMQHISIRDLLMHVCDLTTIRANEKWRLLPGNIKSKLEGTFQMYQFPGKGNKPEPVITFKGALQLVMHIPGRKAGEFRAKLAPILQRVYTGDDSLLEASLDAEEEPDMLQMSFSEAQEYARWKYPADVEPEQELPLKRKASEPEQDPPLKRKASEQEDLDFKIRSLDYRTRLLDFKARCYQLYKEVTKDWDINGRARTIFQENYLTLAALDA